MRGRPSRALRRFIRAERGAAAVEMALLAAVLSVPLINVVDLAFYTFRKVQVEMAAEAGVQAIRRACGSPNQTPVTQNCAAGLSSLVTTAVQGTSLGAKVTVTGGTPLEGYYCTDSSRNLQLVGTTGTIGSPPTKPPTFNCSAYGASAATPGDYVQVSVSYTYTPLFQRASIVSLLPTPIVRTAWYRAI